MPLDLEMMKMTKMTSDELNDAPQRDDRLWTLLGEIIKSEPTEMCMLSN